MLATEVNNLGKKEKNSKVKQGVCIFPFKYKYQEHNKCIETDKGDICATEVNPKTNTLTKYGYCQTDKKNSIKKGTKKRTLNSNSEKLNHKSSTLNKRSKSLKNPLKTTIKRKDKINQK